MLQELALTATNRLRLAAAFRAVPRVDYAIDCVIEGQMGQAFVDDPTQPGVYMVGMGPFRYFAGTAVSPQAAEVMATFPAYHLLMPSTDGWVELARRQFGDVLQTNVRHSFAADHLSAAHLQHLLAHNAFKQHVQPIDAALAARLSTEPEAYFDLGAFESAADFAARGVGCAAIVAGQPVGAAFSSLVCSRGIEVSIFVRESHRRQASAVATPCRLLLTCLQRQLHPNWDAANPESVRLAKKLGYRATGDYEAYYHVRN